MEPSTRLASSDEAPESVRRAADLLGRRPIGWHRPEFGLSGAERHVVTLDDGARVFVKAATDARTTTWLRTERTALDWVGEHLGPRMLAWDEDGAGPVLVVEDLSQAYWPAATGTTVWRPGDIDAVIAALRDLGRLPTTPALPVIGPPPAHWPRLIAEQIPVRLGLCSQRWLDRNGPALIELDRAEPGALDPVVVHGDVRSDNLCLSVDGTVRLVDWAQAGIGHPQHDLITVLPTIHLEGGPRPADVLRGPAELIVRFGGGMIARAAGERSAPGWLREVFGRLAGIHLTWIADILKLPLDP